MKVYVASKSLRCLLLQRSNKYYRSFDKQPSVDALKIYYLMCSYEEHGA